MLGCAIVLTIGVVVFAYSPKLAAAIVVIGIGALVTIDFLDRRLAKPRIRSRDEVAKILREAMDEWATPDDAAWNDFIRYRIQDTELDEIRSRCARLEEKYPAGESGRVLSQAGEDLLREIIKELEQAR